MNNTLNIEKIRTLVKSICPKQEHLLDDKKVISFFESLKPAFAELNLEKKFTAKGLYSGVDFAYRHPLVFWTRTGIDFAKRYPDELYADFYVEGNKLCFETSNVEEQDFMDYYDGELSKQWPLTSLHEDPEALKKEVMACFKAFYSKYHATKNW